MTLSRTNGDGQRATPITICMVDWLSSHDTVGLGRPRHRIFYGRASGVYSSSVETVYTRITYIYTLIGFPMASQKKDIPYGKTQSHRTLYLQGMCGYISSGKVPLLRYILVYIRLKVNVETHIQSTLLLSV